VFAQGHGVAALCIGIGEDEAWGVWPCSRGVDERLNALCGADSFPLSIQVAECANYLCVFAAVGMEQPVLQDSWA
jgi:hypothetical protein